MDEKSLVSAVISDPKQQVYHPTRVAKCVEQHIHDWLDECQYIHLYNLDS